MPRSLPEVNVTEDKLQIIAEYTMLDFWSRTNPRPINGPEDVMTILEMVKA
jgi:Alcohol dehydrogenase, class IV